VETALKPTCAVRTAKAAAAAFVVSGIREFLTAGVAFKA
jgi:hypothetical protein